MVDQGLRRELLFWLQIMGDHARFIKASLHTDRSNLVMIAVNFVQVFDKLLAKGRQEVNEDLANETIAVVISFRELKRELLSYRLRNLSATNLPPTFLNHMLNELEEFLAVLAIRTPEDNENIIGQHLLWTLDAAGHAAVLYADLDKVEYGLRNEASIFLSRFDELYLKAVEIAGYYRSSPLAVQSVLEAFNLEIVKVMQDFMGYLDELKLKIIKDQVLSSLSPLIPDHMYREECYYLHKIARFQTGIPKLECDPAKTRVDLKDF